MTIGAPPASAAQFSNGSFEIPDIGNVPFGVFPAGSNIGPWVVTGAAGTGVDIVTTAGGFPTVDGDQAIELAGSPGPGGVRQVFNTPAGFTYNVRYYAATRCATGSDVRALINGTVVDSVSFPAPIGYQQRDFTFQSVSGQTAIEFDTTTGGACANQGTFLDYVRIWFDCDPLPTNTTGFQVVRLTAGDDVYDGSGAAGPLFIIGGEGHDRITGSAFADVILGGPGNDTINGGGGSDGIWGEEGNDIINGNAGDDGLCGGIGNDSISGGLNDDFIFGQAGNDNLLGDEGDDIIKGGVDNDYLNGGAGTNSNNDTVGFNYCVNPSPCGTDTGVVVFG